MTAKTSERRGQLSNVLTAAGLAVSLLLGAVHFCAASAHPALGEWDALEAGLELGRFNTEGATPVDDSIVVVLRVDPELWDMAFYCASEKLGEQWWDASDWADAHGLTVATNAGMFAEDRVTHVGHMSCNGHVNNERRNSYLSVAAFGPMRDGLPDFRIFDLDAPGVTIDCIREDYGSVVQNLRLIKRPGENRWVQQDRMWSEMALGEDSAGRMLLIFCRSPYSMHDLNRILLSLPIDLVAAQHLEGGPEAQLVIRTGETELELCGSYETDFLPDNSNHRLWPIPNVLGVKRRVE